MSIAVAVAVVVVVVVVVTAAAALLGLGRLTRAPGRTYVSTQVRYQPVALVVAALAVLAVRLLVPGHADYLRVGDWAAPAADMAWLGVAAQDTWRSVGATFLVVMTVVTAVVMWWQLGRGSRIGVRALVRALPVGIVLSIVNALTEELVFRVAVAEGLGPVLPATAVALVSAGLFGVPHWFGRPGRVPGVLLAGFMGWFLTLSVLQTGGIGWAWTIHAVQDVVIITLLIAVDRRSTVA
jgi:membrane protease YdiL (CAAX protease family)